MTQEKMRVAEALVELKTLENRLERAINTGVFVTVNKHSNTKIEGKTIKEFVDEVILASYNKAVDLDKRFEAIKAAVSRSNAATIVKVGDKEYTVAEAIWMKQKGICYKQLLLDEMRSQYAKVKKKLAFNDSQELEDKATAYATGLYGAKETKTAADEIEKVKKAYIEANKIDLIDPADILKKIQALEEEISVFTAKVDAALNISNAVTEIAVEY